MYVVHFTWVGGFRNVHGGYRFKLLGSNYFEKYNKYYMYTNFVGDFTYNFQDFTRVAYNYYFIYISLLYKFKVFKLVLMP